MIVITLNRGILQECNKKVLKIHLLQTLIFLQRLSASINLVVKWNLKESVLNRTAYLFFIKGS